MNWVHILETLMLVCFGAAWPLSIVKSWRARTARGKSLGFLAVILLGYAAGLLKVPSPASASALQRIFKPCLHAAALLDVRLSRS